MSKLLESANKRDFDRRISEVVEMLEEKTTIWNYQFDKRFETLP